MNKRNADLQAACARNDLPAVLKLLAASAEPEQITESGGQNLLTLTVSTCPHHEIIEALLKRGADPNFPDLAGRAALHVAAFGSDPSRIRLLLEYGADPNLKDGDGKTPSDYAAAYSNSVEVLNQLNSVKVVKDIPKHARDSLFVALKARDIDTAIRLIRKNPELSQDPKASFLLHQAAGSATSDVVSCMLDIGFDINFPDNFGWRPMHYAVKNQNMPVVRVLIERNALLDVRTREDYIPLHTMTKYARGLRKDSISIGRLLINAGSPTSNVAIRQETLRGAARRNGLDELLDDLPPFEGEVPVDKEARGVKRMIVQIQKHQRLVYRPNDPELPFSLEKWQQRDGWFPSDYAAPGWPGASAGMLLLSFPSLKLLNIEWMTPLMDSWLTGSSMLFSGVIQLHHAHYQKPPVIDYFI